jgi:hypothetical protein
LNAALALLLLTGFYPLWRACRGNRRTTLRHALGWAAAAWTAWSAASALGTNAGLARYLALSLTGCAAVAVLGARRPIVAAWNFVVASLLIVLFWPVVEKLGDLRPSGFLTAVLALLSTAIAVGIVNYLPTRMALVVLFAGAACAVQMGVVLDGIVPVESRYSFALLAVAPWLGLAAARRTLAANEMDREWLDFRDRFGMVWALPACDQFNRASANGGWNIVLGWTGPRFFGDASSQAEALAGLRAVLKRFRSDEI